MTTLYKPVLIETVEQADQLPEGTFITDALDLVARLEKTGRYAGRWLTEEDGCLNDPVMPAQALVPIEADMETREHPYRVEERPESAYLRPVPQVRYKTLWEDA